MMAREVLNSVLSHGATVLLDSSSYSLEKVLVNSRVRTPCHCYAVVVNCVLEATGRGSLHAVVRGGWRSLVEPGWSHMVARRSRELAFVSSRPFHAAAASLPNRCNMHASCLFLCIWIRL